MPLNLTAHIQGQRAGAVVAFRRLHPHRLRDGDADRRSRARAPSGSGRLPQEADGREAPAPLAALDLAVAKSGYGKKALPKGQAWGVAVHESFNTVIAYVVVASMKDGRRSCTRSPPACIATWRSTR